jgi:hypothetical protein
LLWTWQRFFSGHCKRGVWLLGEFFSPLPAHLVRPERNFYLCPSQDRELAEEIITTLEFKKGQ